MHNFASAEDCKFLFVNKLHNHTPCMDIVPIAEAFSITRKISNKGDVKRHMINRYIIKSPVIQSQPAERLKVAIASTSEMTSRPANCTVK